MADAPPPYPGTPRWAKVLGTVIIVVIVLFFGLLSTRGVHRGHGAHADVGTAALHQSQA